MLSKKQIVRHIDYLDQYLSCKLYPTTRECITYRLDGFIWALGNKRIRSKSTVYNKFTELSKKVKLNRNEKDLQFIEALTTILEFKWDNNTKEYIGTLLK